MSRVGRLPIAIPADVTVTVTPDNVVTVKGPKGELVKTMHADISIAVENNEVIVTRHSDQKEHRALHGLTRALINNMVIGVKEGYQKTLDLVGVGYRAQLQGQKLVMNLGYSSEFVAVIPEGLTVTADKDGKLTISGIDKQQVGEFSAQIRKLRKPEPYKGKGIRYDNEVIRRKVGKTGVK